MSFRLMWILTYGITRERCTPLDVDELSEEAVDTAYRFNKTQIRFIVSDL